MKIFSVHLNVDKRGVVPFLDKEVERSRMMSYFRINKIIDAIATSEVEITVDTINFVFKKSIEMADER